MPSRAIQFTQEQARALTGITPGDFRHWRKVVPYLTAKAGKAARFSFADLVGLAVLTELTRSYGVHIANAAQGVDVLFRELGRAAPVRLDGAVALVTPRDARLCWSDDVIARGLSEPALLVPCDPLIARVRTGVLPTRDAAEPSEQTVLPFPPQLVRTGT